MLSKRGTAQLSLSVTFLAASLLTACTTQPAPAGEENGPTAAHSHGVWTFNRFDQEELAGFADAVFVGRVLEQSGSEQTESSLPQTQFIVSVRSALKGDVPQRVTVNQQGGVNEDTGQLELLEGDTLLEPGRTYLFAGRYTSLHDWYTVVPQTGNVLLNAREVQGLERAEQQRNQSLEPEVIQEMRAAIRNAVPFDDPQPRRYGQGTTPRPGDVPTIEPLPERPPR